MSVAEQNAAQSTSSSSFAPASDLRRVPTPIDHRRTSMRGQYPAHLVSQPMPSSSSTWANYQSSSQIPSTAPNLAGYQASHSNFIPLSNAGQDTAGHRYLNALNNDQYIPNQFGAAFATPQSAGAYSSAYTPVPSHSIQSFNSGFSTSGSYPVTNQQQLSMPITPGTQTNVPYSYGVPSTDTYYNQSQTYDRRSVLSSLLHLEDLIDYVFSKCCCQGPQCFCGNRR